MKNQCKKKDKATVHFEDNRKLQKAIQSLCDQVRDYKPDTSNDGISYIENEEGTCVQIISNGNCVLMSINMFELLLTSSTLSHTMSNIN